MMPIQNLERSDNKARHSWVRFLTQAKEVRNTTGQSNLGHFPGTGSLKFKCTRGVLWSFGTVVKLIQQAGDPAERLQKLLRVSYEAAVSVHRALAISSPLLGGRVFRSQFMGCSRWHRQGLRLLAVWHRPDQRPIVEPPLVNNLKGSPTPDLPNQTKNDVYLPRAPRASEVNAESRS